jgi:hypothetical protein
VDAPITAALSRSPTASVEPQPQQQGVDSRARGQSFDLDLPFVMDEGPEESPAGGERRSGERRSGERAPRLSAASEDVEAEAAIGSLMMEVEAAPTLQLFSASAAGRTSPLNRSVEDISSQLDRLTQALGADTALPGLLQQPQQQQQPPPPPMGSMVAGRAASPNASTVKVLYSAECSPPLGSSPISSSPILAAALPPAAARQPAAVTSIGVAIGGSGGGAMARTSNTSSSPSSSPPVAQASIFDNLTPAATAVPVLATRPPPSVPVPAPVPVPVPVPVQQPPSAAGAPQDEGRDSTEALLAAQPPPSDATLFPFAPLAHED